MTSHLITNETDVIRVDNISQQLIWGNVQDDDNSNQDFETERPSREYLRFLDSRPMYTDIEAASSEAPVSPAYTSDTDDEEEGGSSEQKANDATLHETENNIHETEKNQETQNETDRLDLGSSCQTSVITEADSNVANAPIIHVGEIEGYIALLQHLVNSASDVQPEDNDSSEMSLFLEQVAGGSISPEDSVILGESYVVEDCHPDYPTMTSDQIIDTPLRRAATETLTEENKSIKEEYWTTQMGDVDDFNSPDQLFINSGFECDQAVPNLTSQLAAEAALGIPMSGSEIREKEYTTTQTSDLTDINPPNKLQFNSGRETRTPTPTNLRDFWNVVSETQKSGQTSTKQREPSLQQAVPVSSRRHALLSAISIPKEQERNSAVDRTVGTSLRERTQSLFLERSTPKRRLSETDAGIKAASMTPLAARQAALALCAVYYAVPREDDALRAATATPVDSRKASLMADTEAFKRKGTLEHYEVDFEAAPLHERMEALRSAARSISKEHERDPTLDRTVCTPLYVRTEALFSEKPLPKRELTEIDAGLKAASMTPVIVRQACLAADAASIATTNLHNDAAIAGIGTTVDSRRTAFIAELAKHRDIDKASVAISDTMVSDRRAQLINELSSILLKSASRNIALDARQTSPVGSVRAVQKGEKVSTPKRETSLATFLSPNSRQAAINVELVMSRSSTPTFEEDEEFLSSSTTSLDERRTMRNSIARIKHNSSSFSRMVQAELDAFTAQNLASSRRIVSNRRARHDRLFYRLGHKNGGLTADDYDRLDDFLPHDTLPDETKASKDAYTSFDSCDEPETLRVWLIGVEEKIFEIVQIKFRNDMTVAEVIEDACAFALDPVLSNQRYVSLCNRTHEIFEPSKAIRSLIRLRSGRRHQTVMAVPFGSKASTTRNIKRVLEETKKVKQLLQKPDPFRPEVKSWRQI